MDYENSVFCTKNKGEFYFQYSNYSRLVVIIYTDWWWWKQLDLHIVYCSSFIVVDNLFVRIKRQKFNLIEDLVSVWFLMISAATANTIYSWFECTIIFHICFQYKKENILFLDHMIYFSHCFFRWFACLLD